MSAAEPARAVEPYLDATLPIDARVEDLLARLPAPQAEAIRARVIDEIPYGRIAAAVRCSESVIRQRVSRGLATLRAIVEEGDGSPGGLASQGAIARRAILPGEKEQA